MNQFTNYTKKLIDASNNTTDGELKARFKHRETAAELVELAKTMDNFGGRRFLGLTKNNNEVWISYNIDKKTMKLTVTATHNLKNITQKAPKRITLATGQQAPDGMMTARGNDTGAVTDSTLRYMQQLLDMPEAIGKVDGKCSSQLFMYVSNAIYEGKWGLQDNKVRWIDVLKAWDFPAGKYFTIYG